MVKMSTRPKEVNAEAKEETEEAKRAVKEVPRVVVKGDLELLHPRQLLCPGHLLLLERPRVAARVAARVLASSRTTGSRVAGTAARLATPG